MRNVCKKAVNAVIAVILILSVIICGAAVYGIHAAVVISGSMEPEITTGSLCFTNCRDKDDIKKGDIIAYNLNDITVTHRVADITAEGYVTKGDNNENEDILPVTDDQVIGKVFYSINNAGYIISFLRSRTGSSVILCLILSSSIISLLLKSKDA